MIGHELFVKFKRCHKLFLASIDDMELKKFRIWKLHFYHKLISILLSADIFMQFLSCSHESTFILPVPRYKGTAQFPSRKLVDKFKVNARKWGWKSKIFSFHLYLVWKCWNMVKFEQHRDLEIFLVKIGNIGWKVCGVSK